MVAAAELNYTTNACATQMAQTILGDGDIDPGNLNGGTNQNLFVDNTTDAFNTEMDGFTVTMTLKRRPERM